MLLYLILAAVIGYLLGSIPVGYLIARSYGIDIREHGSRNIGATNVGRVLGQKPGRFVFLCDALKGVLAVSLSRYVAAEIIFLGIQRQVAEKGLDPDTFSASAGDLNLSFAWVGIVGGLACILGHNFPVWLHFKGGKGVATTIGVLLALMPLAFLVVAAVWVAVFYAKRYVSLASIVAVTVLPFAVLALNHWRPVKGGVMPMFCFSVVAAVLVWWRHRANIQRLRTGTELRFERKPKSGAEPASEAAPKI